MYVIYSMQYSWYILTPLVNSSNPKDLWKVLLMQLCLLFCTKLLDFQHWHHCYNWYNYLEHAFKLTIPTWNTRCNRQMLYIFFIAIFCKIIGWKCWYIFRCGMDFEMSAAVRLVYQLLLLHLCFSSDISMYIWWNHLSRQWNINTFSLLAASDPNDLHDEFPAVIHPLVWHLICLQIDHISGSLKYMAHSRTHVS